MKPLWRAELGVLSLGHRKQLLAAIATLAPTTDATPLAPTRAQTPHAEPVS